MQRDEFPARVKAMALGVNLVAGEVVDNLGDKENEFRYEH